LLTSQPAPVTCQITNPEGETAMGRRLTNNRLFTAVLAAAVAVAGIISYAISRSQDQYTARQVTSAQPAPAAPQPERPEAKVRRRWVGVVTNNALAASVLAAAAAGIISYAIAHSQDQDAARQAMAAGRASAALQLETAATGFYQVTFDLYPTCGKIGSSCLDDNAYSAASETFRAAMSNVSDPAASALAKLLINSATITLVNADSASASNLNQVDETYGELIDRCGQLVQGQQ
jgi:hypothetical protein